MAVIRPCRADDLDALYRICLLTADAGEDGTALYRDPKLVGHVYAGPYGALFRDTSFVVEDEAGAGGYIVGAADTHAYERRLEAEWWPALRAVYPDPARRETMDDRMAHHIHHPEITEPRLYEPYPAHLHINLLPRFRRRGIGRRLVDTWLARVAELGARGAHLGVGLRNAGAVAFYRSYGFHDIEHEDGGRTLVMGIATGAHDDKG